MSSPQTAAASRKNRVRRNKFDQYDGVPAHSGLCWAGERHPIRIHVDR